MFLDTNYAVTIFSLTAKIAALPIRTGSSLSTSRADNLRAWQSFNKNMSFAQDIAGTSYNVFRDFLFCLKY